MRARAPLLSILLLTVLLWVPAAAHAASAAAPPDSTVAADSLQRGPMGPLTAYQTAWRQRQAGDPNAALRTTDLALSALQTALEADSVGPPGERLRELRDQIEGLRDTVRLELTGASAGTGDEADESVLNAEAIDGLGSLEPQNHELVTKYINFFAGAGRSNFERWLKRSGRYMDLFRSVLQREGLPPDLVHLVFVESGFNLNARSVSAAVGPWQFLRSTARLFGLTVDRWVDERKDPEKATVAAARYLKHLYSIFGDWTLAIASYNAGEGRVLRAIKAQGTTNYWDLKLPRQTEDYVPQFMAALTIARDPAKYGFDSVELDDPLTFDVVALKGPVDLQAVAKLADCSYQELKELNPAVLRGAARGSDGITTLRVPSGKAEVLMRRVQDGKRLSGANLTIRHQVRKGETLSGIASRHGVSAQDLARDNGITRARLLQIGMVLDIRSKASAKPVEVIDPATDPRASTAYVPPRQIRTPATLEGHSTAEGRTVVTVQRGETLSAIAERHGVTTQDLVRWNQLKSTRVWRGLRLKVRAPEAVALERARADSAQIANLKVPQPRKRRGQGASSGTIVVRRGDTLSHIARRHGVTVSALKRVNGLGSSQIRAGQRLKLPA